MKLRVRSDPSPSGRGPLEVSREDRSEAAIAEESLRFGSFGVQF